MSMLFPGGTPLNREIVHDIAEEHEAEVARHAELVRQLHQGEEAKPGLGARLRSFFRR